MSNARNSKDAKRLTKLYGTRERGVGHQRVLLLIRERGLDGAIEEIEAMGFRPLTPSETPCPTRPGDDPQRLPLVGAPTP